MEVKCENQTALFEVDFLHFTRLDSNRLLANSEVQDTPTRLPASVSSSPQLLKIACFPFISPSSQPDQFASSQF